MNVRRITNGAAFGHGRAGPWVSAALAVSLGLSGPGCGPKDDEIHAFVHDWEASVSAADYRVQPPDTLEISSAQAPELDGEIQTIRQDGKVTLRLVGEVKVAGLTPVEISRKLESLLSQYYVEPHVSVRVSTAGSKRFYVFGEVAQEGAFPYTGRDTLLNALAASRPTFIAAKEMIKVIRPSHEPDKRHVMVIDAYSMMEHGKLEQNVLLQEGDIVYVPPTVIGWMGLRLRELLFPLIPVGQAYTTPANMMAAYDVYHDDDD
ncbi:MAG: hypothetical protein DCC65_02275 [Planctomycetota bacterium]|nr:MAG: hypothetical protein DCC65_02275 [Planctomycetota bacterium]